MPPQGMPPPGNTNPAMLQAIAQRGGKNRGAPPPQPGMPPGLQGNLNANPQAMAAIQAAMGRGGGKNRSQAALQPQYGAMPNVQGVPSQQAAMARMAIPRAPVRPASPGSPNPATMSSMLRNGGAM
jgi:hypothetical protein